MPPQRPIVHVEFSTGTRVGRRFSPSVAVKLPIFNENFYLFYSW